MECDTALVELNFSGEYLLMASEMTPEQAVGILRARWRYVEQYLPILDLLVSHRAHAEIGEAIDTALVAAGSGSAEGMDSGGEPYRVMVDALHLVFLRGKTEARCRAAHSLSTLNPRGDVQSVASSLAQALSDPDAAVAESAAWLLWNLRRTGTVRAKHQESLREALYSAHGAVRFYSGLTLAHDCTGEERALALRTVRSSTPPTAFGDTISGGFPGEMWCDTDRASWSSPDDGEAPSHVPRRCLACGNTKPEQRHHDLTVYSIGILETAEFFCRDCGFFSIFDLDM